MTSKQFLIPVDSSTNSLRAFEHYLQWIHEQTDSVILLHVFELETPDNLIQDGPSNVEDMKQHVQEQKEKAAKLLKFYEKLCKPHGITTSVLLEWDQCPGACIVRVAERNNVDHIVMGARGTNTIRRTPLGSVCKYVLHHAHSTVTVVPLHDDVY